MRENVFYVEAEPSQYIINFIEELIDIRKNKKLNVIGVFNDRILKVEKNTTIDDLKKQWIER